MAETWLYTESDVVNIPDYELHHLPRSSAYTTDDLFYESLKNMSHGGVGVYAKADAVYHEIRIEKKNLEVLIFRIPEIDCIIVNIYRTQQYSIDKFLTNLHSLLCEIIALFC